MATCLRQTARCMGLQAEPSSLPFFKIKTFNAISKTGLMNGFDYTRFEVSSDANSPHAILLRSHNLQLDEVDPSVCAIARCGAGVNNVPVDELTKRAVPVFNTPGSNANAVKELVLCGLFLSSRKITQGITHMQNIIGEESDPANVKVRVEADKKMFGGQEVMGKTLGVLGLGNIGAKVALAGLSLGMKVIGYDPEISEEVAWSLPGDRITRAHNPEDLYKQADYVSVHIPYIKDATHHTIGKSALAHLKPGAHLLNFSRAELVDGEALRAAMDAGSFKGNYITDFPDPAVQQHEQCICIPHLGASTAEAEQMSAQMAAEQISRFLSNGDIRYSVNFPSVSLPTRRAAQTRLCIVNQNSPGSLGDIFTHLGSLDLNINQHVNSSRGEIAYNVLDIDGLVPDPRHLLSTLDQVPGVMSGRFITNSNERFYHKCMYGSSVSGL